MYFSTFGKLLLASLPASNAAGAQISAPAAFPSKNFRYFICMVPAMAGTSERKTAMKRPVKTDQAPYLCTKASALSQCSGLTLRPNLDVRNRGPKIRPISYPVLSPMTAPITAIGMRIESLMCPLAVAAPATMRVVSEGRTSPTKAAPSVIAATATIT